MNNKEKLFYQFVEKIGLSFNNAEKATIKHFASTYGDEIYFKTLQQCYSLSYPQINYSTAKRDIINIMFEIVMHDTAMKQMAEMSLSKRNTSQNSCDDTITKIFLDKMKESKQKL